MSGAFGRAAFSDAFDTGSASFTIDAVLRAARTGSFTANSILRVSQQGSFTLDAVLAILSHTFTLDAVLRVEKTGSFTAAAVLRKTQAGSFTAASILRKTSTGSFTVDAAFAVLRTGSFTANAVVHATQAGSFTLRACIRNDEAAVAAATGVNQIHIRVDGLDITDDVIFKDATFTTYVNGQVGSFWFRVKDTDRTRSCVTGQEVTLDINGVRRFGGYLMTPARAYFFPVEDTSNITRVARMLTFSGVDYNALFDRRVVYDKVRPANVLLRSWPEDTADDTIIKYVFDHYTDLFDDGFTTDGVEHVGFPNPDRTGVVGSGGLRFGDLMREVNRLIGAVWYFSPTKDLTWADVDVPNASKSLSDNPSGAEIGYREFSHVSNGARLANDAMVWGAAQGASRMAFGRETDATSIAAHGLWQYGEFTTQLYKQASVDLRAATIVDGTPQSKRGGKDDQISWMAQTYDPVFVIGQKVTIESEVYGKSDVVPIRKMTITFPTKTKPLFDMVLSHEIDEPWNTFEWVFPRFSFRFPDFVIGDFPMPTTIIDDFERTAGPGVWGTPSRGAPDWVTSNDTVSGTPTPTRSILVDGFGKTIHNLAKVTSGISVGANTNLRLEIPEVADIDEFIIEFDLVHAPLRGTSGTQTANGVQIFLLGTVGSLGTSSSILLQLTYQEFVASPGQLQYRVLDGMAFGGGDTGAVNLVGQGAIDTHVTIDRSVSRGTTRVIVGSIIDVSVAATHATARSTQYINVNHGSSRSSGGPPFDTTATLSCTTSIDNLQTTPSSGA